MTEWQTYIYIYLYIHSTCRRASFYSCKLWQHHRLVHRLVLEEPPERDGGWHCGCDQGRFGTTDVLAPNGATVKEGWKVHEKNHPLLDFFLHLFWHFFCVVTFRGGGGKIKMWTGRNEGLKKSTSECHGTILVEGSMRFLETVEVVKKRKPSWKKIGRFIGLPSSKMLPMDRSWVFF